MVRERVGDWRLAWRFAIGGLIAGFIVIAIGETEVTAGTFDGEQQNFGHRIQADALSAVLDDRYIRVQPISAARLLVFKVTAIREDKESPWVPMPTEAATSAYSAKKQLYATQSVFA